MRDEDCAEEHLGLRDCGKRQSILSDIIGVHKLIDPEQLTPLLPANDTISLPVIGNIIRTERLESTQDFVLGHADIAICNCVCRSGGEAVDDKLIRLAPQCICTCAGDNLAFIDVDFQFIQTVDPVSGVIIA